MYNNSVFLLKFVLVRADMVPKITVSFFVDFLTLMIKRVSWKLNNCSIIGYYNILHIILDFIIFKFFSQSCIRTYISS